MIKGIFNISLIFYLFFISCKRNEEKKEAIYNEKALPNVLSEIKSDSIKEIYIGKVFFSGDELNFYSVLETNSFKQIDSMSYSIYKNNKNDMYVFSLEKFLKNEDVEKWKIIDTINIKNYNSKDFIIKENIIKENVSVEIYLKNKSLKKWMFNKKRNNPLISLYNIDGWRVMCNNYLTHLDISKKDSEMFLYSDNDIYINIEVVPEINKENEFYIKFKNTARYKDYYPEKKHIIDNEISKTENIAKLTLKGDKLIMDWYGLYNTKTQTRDFVKECIFVRENDGVNTIELSKCE